MLTLFVNAVFYIETDNCFVLKRMVQLELRSRRIEGVSDLKVIADCYHEADILMHIAVPSKTSLDAQLQRFHPRPYSTFWLMLVSTKF